MELDSNTIPDFFTPNTLAKFLSISRMTVYRFIDRRVLPFYRFEGSIRFAKKDVFDYLGKQRIESAK